MKDLPAAGQRGIAAFKGLSIEVEDGKPLYEAEFKVNGRGRGVPFDESRNLVSVEERVALDSIPPAARDAIRSCAAAGKINLVEKVTNLRTPMAEPQVVQNDPCFQRLGP